MPVVGWRIGERVLTFEEAIAIAEEQGHLDGFPHPVLRALAERNLREPGIRINPSLLGGCLRRRVLEEEVDFYINLEHEWAPAIGRAVHEWIERNNPGTSELLLETTVNVYGVPMVLRGRIDYYDADSRTLYDFKTVSEFTTWNPETRQRVPRELPEPSHVFQVNAYAYLLRTHGYPVERGFLWYVRVYREPTRRLIEVDLWDDEEFLLQAVEMARPLAEWVRDGKLPEPKEGYWCRRCPVFEACQANR